MDIGSGFGFWVVGAMIAFVLATFLFDALIALPGRLLLRLIDSDAEPTDRTCRAVGMGVWSAVVFIAYAMTN